MDIREQLQTTLIGVYTIERELGGAGMSRVFVAEEHALGRKVVVKVLPPDLAAGMNVDRFRREIALAARLQHPHIVPLFTAGEVNGLPYFTMPYVEGESLRHRLTRGELPVNDVIWILRDVVKALAYAHRNGVVHRDIKPDNVLISGHAATVTDFGVAKALSLATNPGATITDRGLTLGTPAYMSPEQATGDPNLDYRTDLYALGVLAYEMLVGHTPFYGRPAAQTLAAQVTEAPKQLVQLRESIPPALAALVMQCLEKRAADRPQSAEEVLIVLGSAATPSAGITPVSGSAVPTKTSARKLPKGAWVIAAIVLLALSTTLIFQRNRFGSPATAPGNRVLVAAFENRTGDSSLAGIGEMAADWIARGLQQTGFVEVVDPVSALLAARDTTVNAAGLTGVRRAAAMADKAGTKIVVWGSIYRQGDSLVYASSITDVAGRELLMAQNPVNAALSNPLEGAERLRESVAGALASLLDRRIRSVTSLGSAPPTFAAYREFIRGLEAFRSVDPHENDKAFAHFEAAARLDTTFALPLVWAVFAHGNSGRQKQADSVVDVLASRRSRLAAIDAYALDYFLALRRNDSEAKLRAARAAAELNPGSEWSFNASSELLAAHRPREALRYLHQIDPAHGWAGSWFPYWRSLTTALHLVKDYKNELDAARRARQAAPRELGFLFVEARALTAMGRVTESLEFLDEVLDYTPTIQPPGQLLGNLGQEFRTHGYRSEAERAFSQADAWFKSPAADNFVRMRAGRTVEALRLEHAVALYEAEKWTQARALLETLDAAKNPLTRLFRALIAARVNDSVEAERALASFESEARGGDREALYRAARIAAALGQKERAVQLLAEYLNCCSHVGAQIIVHRDLEWLALRDYAPFQALVRPRG